MTSSLPPVFVTYGWCRVSYVILQSLARRNVAVHFGDASRLAMCRYSRRSASFSRYRSPYRDAAGFVEDVASALARTGARILIPGHEDALAIARHRELIPADVGVPLADAPLIEQLNNKWRTIELARAAGVAVPESFKPLTRDELQTRAEGMPYPAIVKTQIGNSGKGVCSVHSARECVDAFDALVSQFGLAEANWPIVQEFARGGGYGVCLLYNKGQLRASFCERYIRCKDGDFGTSVFRESVDVPHLVEQATLLMEGLAWHGVVHVDFIYDEATGRSALIEVNPRFWGALDLAVRAGVDFPWLLYRMAVDGDVEPVTSYRVGVTSRWIVGEMLHVFNAVRRGRLGQAARTVGSIIRTPPDGYDDFRWSDPLPLVVEALYYGSRFLATRSTNPVEDGMIG